MAKKLISFDDAKPGLGLPDVVEGNLNRTFSRIDVAPTGTLEGDKAAVIAAALAAKNAGRLEVTMAPGLYRLDGVTVADVHGRYLVGDGVEFTPGSFVYPFRTGEIANRTNNAPRSTGQGRIAIEIDDALTNHWTHIFPATKKLGITMGAAWHTDAGGGWIPEAHRHGWEVIAHMPYDLDWRTVPLSELETAAVSCANAIKTAIGTTEGIGFVYPRHNRNSETDRVLSKYFTRGRGHNDPIMYRQGEGHPWLTSAYFLDPRFVGGKMDQVLKELLRQVAAQNGDMVFYMHSGNETHALEQIQALTEFVSFARSLGIQFVNPGQIWGNKNAIPDPYLNDVSRWTIDGAFSWDETTKYHGTRSAKFTPGATGNHGGSLLVRNPYLPTLAPRDGMFGVYRLSARIKTAGATIPGTPNGVRFNMSSIYRRITGETPVSGIGGGATSWLLPASGTTIPPMEWVRIQALTYIGPASNTAQPSLYVQNIAGGSAPIWVDEMKMELVGYVPEIVLRGTLNGTANHAVDSQIHDLARHRYTVIPDSTPKGVVTSAVADGHRLLTKSTDPADTMGYTVIIKPGGKYHDMALTSEGA